MGLIIIRPKQRLSKERIDGVNKALQRLGKHIERCQKDGVPPIIFFDQTEVDVFGSLGVVGCIESVATQTEIGGQMVESTELRIDITDFM